jgi:hypothetical protein
VCGYLAQHPEFGHPEHEGPGATGAALFFVDLPAGSAAPVFARAHNDCRREPRLWRERGNVYVTDHERLTDFLVEHHAAFLRRVGASAASHLNEPALRRLAKGPGVLLVGGGNDGGDLEAVYVYGATAWGAEGIINIGTPNARRHTMALRAWGVETLAAQGIPWLDLGGGAREGDPIAAAKLKWAPRVAAFRRLKQIYRPQDYARLCARAGVAADAGAGYFPAYYAPGVTVAGCG